ncbi:MAG: hypothetical protein RL681_249 [Candidatus Parcubacteria bacterium]|jgi:beta-lactamase class A
MKRWAYLVVLLLGVGVGYLGGTVGFTSLFRGFSLENSTATQVRAGGEFEYINPLLMCGASEGSSFEGFAAAKKTVSDILSKNMESHTVSGAGLYYRDLLSGQWFGVHEDETFAPGSLLKVPLMISYLKQAETDPAVLAQKYSFDGTDDQTRYQNFKPTKPIVPGKPYTVEALLQSMVADSDNNAAQILATHADGNLIDEIYDVLGFSAPQNVMAEGIVSPKNFSYFLRVLYNATYLNREYSERALAVLSQSTFDQGIRAGTPSYIKVAHKFGERVLGRTGTELHDCGIVYYPNHPYALCIMSRGESFQALTALVRDLSSELYKFTDSQYRR